MTTLPRALPVVVACGSLLVAGCTSAASPTDRATPRVGVTDRAAPQAAPPQAAPGPGPGPITLAFGGDVHFEGGLADLPFQPGSTLGPLSRHLRDADLAMVNLETALTRSGTPTDKENEDPGNRYWFSAPPAALDVLDRSGVDVVSMANNHGADFGVAGVLDTLRSAEGSPVALVGIGRDAEQAFEPHRVSVRGTDVAVLAADASPRESADPVWAAAPGSGPGLATARLPHVRPLVAAVESAATTADLVVVYLHWGREYDVCPTRAQRDLAAVLTEAGADVVVGTHAHELQASGTRGSAYVSYGLGNFLWYHGIRPETGVLRLTVQGDEVVGDEWIPGLIPLSGGGAEPLVGQERVDAVADWRRLRGCSDLAPGPGAPGAPGPPGAPGGDLPPFAAGVRQVGPALRARMRSSHDPATCPVPWSDLRYLTLSHVGFDGQAKRGELVVHADVAADAVEVFAALYRARFPIERMRLVDDYDGDDNRSMAANNTSGYNCRRVAGSSSLSDHAFGRAIDLNPVQNPYVRGDVVQPPAGRPYVAVDRSPGARTGRGVIGEDGVVTRSFAARGWTWGGDFTDPDFQHFSTAP